MTVMAYTGHPGGAEEYGAVCSLLAGLSPSYWTTAEVRLVNRPTAPTLLLVWRRSESGGGAAAAAAAAAGAAASEARR
jgi:hypothetical protein